MSSQQMNEIMKDMINNYIKHTRNDLWFQHYPKDYEVVRKLYDIFTRGDELFEYTCYDKMCEGIQNSIDSLIDDFKEKYSIICKYLKSYHIRILSFYNSDWKDDELYKMCKVLDMNKIEDINKGTDSSMSLLKTNNLDRLKLCEYIVDNIYNYI